MNIYHIYTKSIAGYTIFNNTEEYRRIISLLSFYQYKQKMSFSYYIKNAKKADLPLNNDPQQQLVVILAYCVMPTHLHFLLGDACDDETGIENYMRLMLNSYSRFFNLKHKRKGPLWQSRYKRNHIKDDELLLYISRYIHLNPTTARLVDAPEAWAFSSYHEYIGTADQALCSFRDYIPCPSKEYKEFVEEGIEDQRERARMKALLNDDDDEPRS